MTFNENADLDRYLTDYDVAEQEATLAYEFYDFFGWEADVDREERRFVDYSDVLNPDEPVVVGYGGDHRMLIPGA